MKKVVFLGLGYIGLPTAAVAAAHGFEVIGVESYALYASRKRRMLSLS